jgi:hypothetical protein
MLTEAFIEATADFYEDWTLEDFAELVGLPVSELIVYIADHIEDQLAAVESTMGWSDPESENEEER